MANDNLKNLFITAQSRCSPLFETPVKLQTPQSARIWAIVFETDITSSTLVTSSNENLREAFVNIYMLSSNVCTSVAACIAIRFQRFFQTNCRLSRIRNEILAINALKFPRKYPEENERGTLDVWNLLKVSRIVPLDVKKDLGYDGK